MSHCVAIVGGGLSGLTTAKTLLFAGFYCTIYECSSFIGGMFNPSLNPFWPSFKTNLFKYSCAFSDFPWDREAPLFLSQTDVFEYLKNYSTKYIPDSCFKFNCNVRNVAELQDSGFNVDWIETNERTYSDEFIHVVITAGSFSVPHIPKILKSRLSYFKGKLIHRSEYRFPGTYTDQSVAVIGDTFSSSEIFSDIAELASKVTNIIPRNAYILPHFLPVELNHPSTPFLPLNAIFYECKSTAEDITDIPPETMSRNEQIDNIENSDDPHNNLLDTTTELDNINNIILRTGFKPCFDYYLSEKLQSEMKYDPEELFVPVILYDRIFHPKFPNLAFFGMWRALFLCAAELQARYVAMRFANKSESLPIPVPPTTSQEMETHLEIIRSIRNQQQQPQPQPQQQFPFTDYIRMMDNVAVKVKCIPGEEEFHQTETETVVIPVHYQSDYSIANSQNDDERIQWLSPDHPQNISGGISIERIIFRNLLGVWKLTKEVMNHLDQSTSGIVEGSVTFSRSKVKGNSNDLSDLTYNEKGLFVTTSGIEMEVSKVYIYTFNPDIEAIQVYFPVISSKGSSTQPDHPERDYLFVTLKCEQPSDQGWNTVDHHTCRLDDHKATYTFSFQGSYLNRIEIRFRVIGPETNYETISTLSRP